MAISLHTTLRNNRADQITAWAGGSAKLRLYAAAYATELVESICNVTFAPAASGGVLTLNAVANGIAIASGNAAIARLFKNDGTLVMEGMTVTDTSGAGDIQLSQTGTGITNGQSVIIDSATITEGNA